MRVEVTPEFVRSVDKLPFTAREAIDKRLVRASGGNLGDHKSLGGALFEMRIFKGPGYRIYFTRRQAGEIVLCLLSGSKASQRRDIAKARLIVREL